LELVLADGDQLDLDVGLQGEPVDDRLGGLDPVGVVLSGPEDEAAAVVVLAGPAAAAHGNQQEHGKQGSKERPCAHGGSPAARHAGDSITSTLRKLILARKFLPDSMAEAQSATLHLSIRTQGKVRSKATPMTLG
jgi:hypothetical protein